MASWKNKGPQERRPDSPLVSALLPDQKPSLDQDLCVRAINALKQEWPGRGKPVWEEIGDQLAKEKRLNGWNTNIKSFLRMNGSFNSQYYRAFQFK